MKIFALTPSLIWLGGLFLGILAWWGERAAVWGLPHWQCGLGVQALGGLYILWETYRHRSANRPTPDEPCYRTLGLANALSVSRGLVLAWLAGFLCIGWPPEGWLRWMPGLLFTLAILADFADGLLARLTRRGSLLGKYLDLHLDSLGVLIASLLVVRFGQMPWWFALTGLARYLSLAGEAWLKKRGVALRPLPPSASRRAFAGVMMGLLAALLYPIFRPPATVVVGTLLFVPFILGFGRDFLAQAGVRWAAEAPWMRLTFWQPRVLPGVRVATGGLAIALGWLRPLGAGAAPSAALGVLGALGLLLAVGVLPRFTGAALLAWLAAPLAAVVTQGPFVVLAAGAAVALLWGGGRFCLWAPDDYLFLHRVGGASAACCASAQRWKDALATHLARPRVRRVLLWGVVAALLGWSLHNVPLDDLWRTVTHLSPAALAALIALNLLILWMFAGRGWLLLRALGYRIPYRRQVAYRIAAFSVNYFTPGPQFGGEPLHISLLHHHSGVPWESALTMVAVDKLFEMTVNTAFLLMGTGVLMSMDLLPKGAQKPLLGIVVTLVLLPLVYFALLARGFSPARALAQWLKPHKKTSRIAHLLRRVADAETQAGRLFRQHPKVMVQALGISLFTWALLIAEYALMLWAVGLRLSFWEIIAILTAARWAFLSPTPSGLGALEAGQVLAMRTLGYDPALGITVSLLIRARDIVVGLLGVGIAKHFSAA